MITMKQLASQLGVSIATVSKALNNSSDVGEATINRVKAAAREAGYYPNSAARYLKTNRSNNIGVLFVDSTNYGLAHGFFSTIFNSIKAEAEKRGYDITFISDNIGGTSMTYLEHCRYRNCDGVICCTNFNNDMVMEMATSGFPMVTIDYLFNQLGAVLSDNVQGMRDLVSYIHSKGHRRIALIHGEDTAVTRYRIASYYKTLNELGVEVPDEYVKSAMFHDPDSCMAPTRALMGLDRPPTCIIYPDDFSYIGGMNELERMGLKIPDDISVAGYDGVYLSQVLRPKLTTLKQDADKMGAASVDLLLEAIENPKTYIPKRVVVKGWVLEGESVKSI